MRRLILAASAAFLLALSASAAALATDPGYTPHWQSPADTAPITSCVTGFSGAIDGAQPDPDGTRITGYMRFCQPEAQVRYFGIEFFHDGEPAAAGYFIPYLGDTVIWGFTGDNFEGVSAVCISPAPNVRVACARVSIDGKTGAVNLTGIAVTDPLVAATSGAMYYCDHGTVINPICATCV